LGAGGRWFESSLPDQEGVVEVTKQQSHLSLYRRWRPQSFADVVDQTEIVRTLRNAVQAGEAAHAYLFAGERGIGKTSIARILARSLNCLDSQDGEPCNACANCQTILANRSLDIVEIDGASNRGIDHIRRLREEVNFSPADLKKKVYIIDEVHMLTNEAFNALLKTLEEPPPHAVFVFATTEPHKVPRTIISRCQAFEFRKIPPAMIAERLAAVAEAEGAKLTPGAIALLAHRANGGMRDGLVMLEQAISYERGEITKETVLDMLGLACEETHRAFLEAIREGRRAELMNIIDALVDRGKDLEVFLADAIELLRDRLADPAGSDDCAADIAIARGLLDVKGDLFRALDRRIRLEIGVLDLMGCVGASRKPKGKEARPAAAPPRAEAASSLAQPEISSSETPTETSTPPPTPRLPEDPAVAGTWAELLDEIGRERIAIAAFLTECRPVLRDGKLVLLFHPAHTFHKESLEKSSNLQYLAGAVHRHFGSETFVEVEFDPSVEPKPTTREMLRKKAEIVRHMFDGKIVKEEL
jgi:DNA polymerase-3 subunit gamma/tau